MDALLRSLLLVLDLPEPLTGDRRRDVRRCQGGGGEAGNSVDGEESAGDELHGSVDPDGVDGVVGDGVDTAGELLDDGPGLGGLALGIPQLVGATTDEHGGEHGTAESVGEGHAASPSRSHARVDPHA